MITRTKEEFNCIWSLLANNPTVYAVFIDNELFLEEPEEGPKIVKILLSEEDARLYRDDLIEMGYGRPSDVAIHVYSSLKAFYDKCLSHKMELSELTEFPQIDFVVVKVVTDGIILEDKIADTYTELN